MFSKSQEEENLEWVAYSFFKVQDLFIALVNCTAPRSPSESFIDKDRLIHFQAFSGFRRDVSFGGERVLLFQRDTVNDRQSIHFFFFHWHLPTLLLTKAAISSTKSGQDALSHLPVCKLNLQKLRSSLFVGDIWQPYKGKICQNGST